MRLIIKMHYTPTTTHHTAFHNLSLHTTNKHKAYLCKWWQNGTRCRDGVKVLRCHSHLVWLVFEVSIPSYMRLFSFRKLFVNYPSIVHGCMTGLATYASFYNQQASLVPRPPFNSARGSGNETTSKPVPQELLH